MRRIGLVCLWLGVLGGAFVSVRHVEHIQWGPYGAMAALAIAGVVMLRRTAGSAAFGAERVRQDVSALRGHLQTVLGGVDDILGRRNEGSVYDVRDMIDNELAEPLGAFADRRETLIAAHGLEVYADVMTRFAGAERLVNRAWSASADGYIDEVWPCLERAQALLRDAMDRFPSSA